jgi:hypothetical protein
MSSVESCFVLSLDFTFLPHAEMKDTENNTRHDWEHHHIAKRINDDWHEQQSPASAPYKVRLQREIE